MLCCICNKREATVFLTRIIGDRMQKLNVCERCSKLKSVKAGKAAGTKPSTLNPTNSMATTTFSKKPLGLETTEPAVTPPSHGETTFVKKPKLGGSKSKK